MAKKKKRRQCDPSSSDYDLTRGHRSGIPKIHRDLKPKTMKFSKEDRNIYDLYPNHTAVTRMATRGYTAKKYSGSCKKDSWIEAGALRKLRDKYKDDKERETFFKEKMMVEQKIIQDDINESSSMHTEYTIDDMNGKMEQRVQEIEELSDLQSQYDEDREKNRGRYNKTDPLRVLEPILPIAILTFLSTRYENMKAGLGSWLSFMTSVGYSLPEAMVAGALSASLVYLSWKWRMWTYRPFRKKSWVPTAPSGSLVLPRARFAITDRISKIVTRTVYSLCGAYLTLLVAGPTVVDLATYL